MTTFWYKSKIGRHSIARWKVDDLRVVPGVNDAIKRRRTTSKPET